MRNRSGKIVPANKNIATNPKKASTNIPNESINQVYQQTITVPIPLRSDNIIEIKNLPFNLTQAEVDKISNVIKAYVKIEE